MGHPDFAQGGTQERSMRWVCCARARGIAWGCGAWPLPCGGRRRVFCGPWARRWRRWRRRLRWWVCGAGRRPSSGARRAGDAFCRDVFWMGAEAWRVKDAGAPGSNYRRRPGYQSLCRDLRTGRRRRRVARHRTEWSLFAAVFSCWTDLPEEPPALRGRVRWLGHLHVLGIEKVKGARHGERCGSESARNFQRGGA
jgi:hypothetical protein